MAKFMVINAIPHVKSLGHDIKQLQYDEYLVNLDNVIMITAHKQHPELTLITCVDEITLLSNKTHKEFYNWFKHV